MHDAPFQVTLDVVLVDQALHQLHGFQPHIPQGLCLFQAEHLLQILLPLALPYSDMTTVAPRGTPSDPLSLQHHYLKSAFSQMQCR